MPPSDTRNGRELSSLVTLASLALVVAIVYFAQDMLLPIAVAILLAFVLTPLTAWLERLALPRIASVLTAVLLAFTILGGIAWVVTDELLDLARDVPTYQQTRVQKIRALKEVPVGGGLLAGLTTQRMRSGVSSASLRHLSCRTRGARCKHATAAAA